MGAWIETFDGVNGLQIKLVASYMGAWIETLTVHKHIHLRVSHPTWVRGLKLSKTQADRTDYESHPTWVRGLKQDGTILLMKRAEVASYMGAWIETLKACNIMPEKSVASYMGAWIETS